RFNREVCYGETDTRLVPVELLAPRAEEVARHLERLCTGTAQFQGSLGKRPEEVLVRNARAREARQYPQQQNPQVFCSQAVFRSSSVGFDFVHQTPPQRQKV